MRLLTLIGFLFIFTWAMEGSRQQEKAGQVQSKTRYEHHRGATGTENLFAKSNGPGLHIEWAGSQRPAGAEPIDVLKATLEHLHALQKTVAASEGNAKLIARLVPAVEEFEGREPTMGGELNKLIPPEDKEDN